MLRRLMLPCLHTLPDYATVFAIFDADAAAYAAADARYFRRYFAAMPMLDAYFAMLTPRFRFRRFSLRRCHAAFDYFSDDITPRR